MLESMAIAGRKCRGIVDIGENIADKDLEKLHDLGVRGIRINVSPIKTYEAGLADRLIGRINRLAELAKGMGWVYLSLSSLTTWDSSPPRTVPKIPVFKNYLITFKTSFTELAFRTSFTSKGLRLLIIMRLSFRCLINVTLALIQRLVVQTKGVCN